ncbi:NAD-dependent epimerase/dehydratase family protein [Aestuariibius insulae]|uniref:NAD-dependent epimerase/dehydratase family protein n=1 Tax=Aestuariibius insulae TaxID=2058287 RepID=UPI00345E58A3
MTDHRQSIILGAGPVGRAIAEALAARGEAVAVVTRDGRDIGPGITPRRADLSDPEETVAACRGADAIYQCAAPPYHQWTSAFPALQEAAIAAAAATGAVLVAVENLYGYGSTGTLTEGMPLTAETRKGALRARLSQELLDAHAAGRAKCVAGRATDFFGPGVRQAALGDRFWPALLSGKTIDWVGDPDAPHSFAYLPDLAAAYAELGRTPETWGQAWHLPALAPISLREICERADPWRTSGPKIRQTPSWLLRAVGLVRPAAGELVEMRYMFDDAFIIDHARFDAAVGTQTSGWDTALSQTVEWWRKTDQKAA